MVSIVAQPCPAFCSCMDCSLPGSPFYGISQARILERVAISSSRGSSGPRDKPTFPAASALAGRFFATEQAYRGFPGGSDGKECLQRRRSGFNPCVRKMSWRRKQQPTPAFSWEISWPEELVRPQLIGLQRVGHD